MKYHAAWLEHTPPWDQVAEQLHPGAWVAYQGKDTLGARAVGLEVRDSVFCATPEGSVVTWLLRNPIQESTVARQTLATGTGGINIDGCRIEHGSPEDLAEHQKGVAAIKARGGQMAGSWKNSSDLSGANEVQVAGRWPANFTLMHSLECLPESCHPTCPSQTLGAQSGIRPGMSGGGSHRADYPGGLFGSIDCPGTARGDTGTASRFFYQATSLEGLKEYFVRLILPPEGKLLVYANPST
jgi:hypothetical protein